MECQRSQAFLLPICLPLWGHLCCELFPSGPNEHRLPGKPVQLWSNGLPRVLIDNSHCIGSTGPSRPISHHRGSSVTWIISCHPILSFDWASEAPWKIYQRLQHRPLCTKALCRFQTLFQWVCGSGGGWMTNPNAGFWVVCSLWEPFSSTLCRCLFSNFLDNKVTLLSSWRENKLCPELIEAVCKNKYLEK